jgi:RNA polymerase sigma-70 factor (ECF subfamily)
VDNEKKLIDEILSGNQAAFERLVNKYERLVAHIVYKMIPASEEFEDICQEVFIKVYKSLKTYRGDARLSTWIGRITYNRCIDYLNRKKIPIIEDDLSTAADYIADNSEGPDSRAELANTAEAVRFEIDRLPPRVGTIVALYHLEDMSYAEIGEILNMPDGTVKSYLFRGRKLLRDRLTSKYNIEELWQ